MEKKLELFKGLFSNYINISILHIDNNLGLVNSTLEEIKNENQGKVKYISFIDEDSAKLSSARVFEYIVLSNILSYCTNKEEILKSHYKALENSGNIIILEKTSNDNRYEILDILENLGFQAPNTIELFDDILIFTAKKMHHWGYGL
ncbi:hypothetical protein CRU92_06155 [Arcobacter sp. FW59]|nr:hypothetical protein CRU92_06155 [Arcobacter sp. FW59]